LIPKYKNKNLIEQLYFKLFLTKVGT